MTSHPDSLEAALAAAGGALGVSASPLPLHTDWTVEEALQSYYDSVHLTISDDALTADAAKAHELPPELQTPAATLLAATADASRARDRAFAGLSPADVAFLVTGQGRVDALLAKPTLSSQELAFLASYRATASRIDTSELLASALTAAAGLDSARATLQAAMAAQGSSGSLSVASSSASPAPSFGSRVLDLLARLAPFGTASAQDASNPVPCLAPATAPNDVVIDASPALLITSCGSSTIDASRGVAAVDIDLGGNDVYLGKVGAVDETNSTAHPVTVLLDMGGDDTYSGFDQTQGAGIFGVGLIMDVAGNDDFEAHDRSQGYGFQGVGAIMKIGGNDVYNAVNASQGRSEKMVAGLSIGMLIDTSGDDSYHSLTGQGYGTGGFLFDFGGHDTYSPNANPTGLPIHSILDLGEQPATLLSERRDNAVWLDGPSLERSGLGVDVELSTMTQKDGCPVVLAALTGVGNCNTGAPSDRALGDKLNGTLVDSDHDGYPDVVEQLFGTDPHNPDSYPLGIPREPFVNDPTGGFLQSLEDLVFSKQNGLPQGSDKIVDLRVPLSDGGHFSYAQTCDEPLWVYTPLDPSHTSDAGAGKIPIVSGTCPNDEGAGVLPASLHPWPGNITLGGDSLVSRQDTYQNGGTQAATTTLKAPTGILAIGDIVPTTYTLDYLVTVDLGGSDHYNNAAGGAALVALHDDSTGGVPGRPAATSPDFTLPVGELSVDVSAGSTSSDNDVYRAPKDTPAQGALGGILVDTGGDDLYVAGANSQGANGGVLLDLAGNDRYAAGDGSQGAAVTEPVSALNLTDDGTARDAAPGSVDASRAVFARDLRALTPSLLLDFTGADTYTAGNESQGYGEAFFTPDRIQDANSAAHGQYSDLGTNPETYGILLDLNGTDTYDTASSHGRYSQGVGAHGGVGILADLASASANVANGEANDIYRAFGSVSQGAAVPSGLQRPESDHNPAVPAESLPLENLGGLGVLLDLAGQDHYRYVNDAGARDRTVERQNRVTLTTAPSNAYLYPGSTGDFANGCTLPAQNPSRGYCLAAQTGLGAMADLECVVAANSTGAPGVCSDANGWPAFLDSVAGTGGSSAIGVPTNATGASDLNDSEFLINLPTAGLGIGSTFNTTWSTDYAFALDLGGNDVFTNNAGGPVFGLNGGGITGTQSGEASNSFALTEFPVTLVDEVGVGDTTYRASRDFAQGVGAFTVGMLVDAGGEDTMSVVPEARDALVSKHTVSPPVLDGVIGAHEWADAKRTDLILNGETDPSDVRNVTLYSMNDDQYAYFALLANWTGAPGRALEQNLSMAFAKDDNDFSARRGALDTVFQCGKVGREQNENYDPQLVGLAIGPSKRTPGETYVMDTYFNETLFGTTAANPMFWDADCRHGIYSHQDIKATRRFANGVWSYEIRMPLSDGDPLDLALHAGPFGGFDNPTVGFHLNVTDPSTGEVYRYPQGSASNDGEAGFPRDANMSAEIKSWASLTFSSSQDANGVAVPPDHHYPHVLTEGAAVAGIGIVAMLGETQSNGVYAGEDMSLGFAAANSLAVWLDAGGSDRYSAGVLSQGAAQVSGLAFFIDLQGDDVYDAGSMSQGWAPGAQTFHTIRAAKKDTYVDAATPTTAHGEDATLLVGGDTTTGSTDRKDIYVAFDISDLPSTGTAGQSPIVSAKLVLAGRSDPTASRPVTVSRFDGDFTESTFTWKDASAIAASKFTNVNANPLTLTSSADGRSVLFDGTQDLAKAIMAAKTSAVSPNFLELRITPSDAASGPTLLFDSRETFPQDRYVLDVVYQTAAVDANPLHAQPLAGAFFLDGGGIDAYRYADEDSRNASATFIGDAFSAPLNDRVWTQGGGLGIDSEILSKAHAIVGQLGSYVGVCTGNTLKTLGIGNDGACSATNPQVVFKILPQASPDCKATSVPATEAGFERMNGTACVIAFAYFPPGAVVGNNLGASGVNPIAWERLDTLVNNRLLTVVPKATISNATAFANGLTDVVPKSDWNATGALFGPFAWDTTATQDGLARVLFRAYGRNAGAGSDTLFQVDNNTARLVIDNPPRVQLLVGPPYGAKGVDAAFGPQSATHDDGLTLSLTPSRDAAEDRLQLANLTPEAQAVYCDSGSRPAATRPLDAGRALCDEYPFYLNLAGSDPTETQNEPPTSTTTALNALPVATGTQQLENGDRPCNHCELDEIITAPADMTAVRLNLFLDRTAPPVELSNTVYTTRVYLSKVGATDAPVLVKTSIVSNVTDVPQACSASTPVLGNVPNACYPPCSSQNTLFVQVCGALPTVCTPGSLASLVCQYTRGGTQAPPEWNAISVDVPPQFQAIAKDTGLKNTGLRVAVTTQWTSLIASKLGNVTSVCEQARQAVNGAAASAATASNGTYHDTVHSVDDALQSTPNGPANGGTVNRDGDFVWNTTTKTVPLSTGVGDDQTCDSFLNQEKVTYTDGLVTNLSRIQVFVPTEPSTHMTVNATSVATGDVTSIPIAGARSDAFEGGLPFVFSWDGAGAADGLYKIAVDAFTTHDGAVQHGTPATANVLLDSTPPTTTLLTPAYVGAALLTDDNQILLRWNADDGPIGVGSGIRTVRLWEAVGGAETPNASAFFPVNDSSGHPDFPGNVHEVGVPKLSSANNYYVVALAEDGVGNIEQLSGGARQAIPGCPPGHLFGVTPASSLVERCRDAGFQAAFEQALAAGAVLPIRVDVTPPVVTDGSISGVATRVVSLNGETLTDVKAGAPVAFHVCAADLGGDATGIANVKVFFVSVPTNANDTILDRTATMTPDGSGCFDYNDWASLNADKTQFPDGRWNVGFEAFDLAANKGEFDLGDIILDSQAPTLGVPVVTPLGPDCAPLAAAQSALRPGDCFEVNLTASEPFGIDEAGAVLHAGAVDTAGDAGFHPVAGTNDSWSAVAVVDRKDLHTGLYELPIDIPDLAGNVAHTNASVSIDLKDFAIDASSIHVTNVSFDSAVVHWTTSEPTTGRVNFGLAPTEFAMKRFSALDANLTTDHAVTVTGLAASSRIYFRVVSSSVSGLTHTSPDAAPQALDFTTFSALYLDPIAPNAGDAVSGIASLKFNGGLHVPGPAVRYDVFVDGDFLTSASSSALTHAIAFNTTRFLDGNHTITVDATSSKDALTAKFGPFLIDNTPPTVVVSSPAVSSRDATPTFDARATDALSGVDLSSFTLTIDGVPIPATSLVVTREGATAHLQYTVEGPLTLGAHAAHLTVADRAGTVRDVAIPFTIDTAPPVIDSVRVGYTPGPSAAKDGSRVTLNVTTSDALGGVAGVAANVSGLAKDVTRLNLVRVPGTDYYVGNFTLVAPSTDGTYEVGILSADVAGNVANSVAEIVVDTVPPTVTDATVGDIGFRAARLTLAANEPVGVALTWSAPDDHGSITTSSLSMHPSVPLSGLLPSRTYAWSAIITDRAGNAVERAGHFDTVADTHAPDAVTGVRAADLHDGRIVLTWLPAHDDVGVKDYRIYRGAAAPGSALTLVNETTALTYTDSGLPLEQSFGYAIAAVDLAGNEGLKSPLLVIASTAPPELSLGDVSPSLGTSSTDFVFTITYRSAGDVEPAYVRVIIDGAPHEMTRTTPAPASSKDGLVYTYTTRLGPTTLDKQHHFSFEANDGRYTVTFPRDTPTTGPMVSGDVSSSVAGGIVAFMKRLPFEGVVGLTGAIALAAAGVYVIRRRRGF
ncbi:MAG: DNRLRE domain-containing protein [Thermoplasmatota archaeon]